MSAIRRFSCAMFAALVAALPVGAQIANVRVSAPGAAAPEEVTIAINPANPSILAAGSNLRYFYRSTDAGLSWSQSLLPPGTYGDPSVTFDANGWLYYGHLANLSPAQDPTAHWIDRILIHRSTDGGATWKDSATVNKRTGTFAQDKEWLASDMTSSPYHGNVYMAWTEFDNYGSDLPTDSSRILFVRSTDGGTTWSAPLRISDRLGNCVDSDSTVEGAVPAVGPNGEVYVAWGGPLGIMFDRSTDGGVTFGTDRFVSDQPGGWDYMVTGINRANGLPITACDASQGPYRGRIYVSWTDQRHGIDNTDVFLSYSTDGGTNWSPASQVNRDLTTRQQFFNWMTVDQADGTVYEVYYDRRETTGDLTDVYVGRSVDGGETFSEIKVSASSFFPVENVFFGDYTNIAALGGKAYPIWMRLDTTTLSVWTAPMNFPPVSVERRPEAIPEHTSLFQNYPNPFNPGTTIRYRVSGDREVRLVVYDLLGREVAVLVDGAKPPGDYEVTFDAAGLASGVYIYRLRAGEYSAEKRMLVIR
jgi:photosystem II stability/assembly factor-like uncharacterized protein